MTALHPINIIIVGNIIIIRFSSGRVLEKAAFSDSLSDLTVGSTSFPIPSMSKTPSTFIRYCGFFKFSMCNNEGGKDNGLNGRGKRKYMKEKKIKTKKKMQSKKRKVKGKKCGQRLKLY